MHLLAPGIILHHYAADQSHNVLNRREYFWVDNPWFIPVKELFKDKMKTNQFW